VFANGGQECTFRGKAEKCRLRSGLRERLSPNQRWAAMQNNEVLARRNVVEVARSSVDGGTLRPIMLHEVARRLKIDEASAEAAMCRAVAERWLIVEGCSLFRIRLTESGRALSSCGH